MQNDLVHVMPWQCMCALYVYATISMTSCLNFPFFSQWLCKKWSCWLLDCSDWIFFNLSLPSMHKRLLKGPIRLHGPVDGIPISNTNILLRLNLNKTCSFNFYYFLLIVQLSHINISNFFEKRLKYPIRVTVSILTLATLGSKTILFV